MIHLLLEAMLPLCLGGKVGCGPSDFFTKIAMWAQGEPEIDSAIQPLSRRANQPVNQSATQPPSHFATQPPNLLSDPATQLLSHPTSAADNIAILIAQHFNMAAR